MTKIKLTLNEDTAYYILEYLSDMYANYEDDSDNKLSMKAALYDFNNAMETKERLN